MGLSFFFSCALANANPSPIPAKPPGYAIASAHPLATNAGLKILAQGGNAFDAAITVAAVLAVVEPYHTGLGGGGFWLLHQGKNHKNSFIDGREVAPLAATETMFQTLSHPDNAHPSLNGPLAAAIPGQVAAMAYIAKQYGTLPLSTTLAPAIQLAEDGFLVDTPFIFFSTMSDRAQWLKKYPATAAIFLKNLLPYHVGDRLIQKDLAKTLRLIAQHGHDGFYAGETAKNLVTAVQKAGGIWTLDDLAQYHIKEREPLIGAYHDMLIITAPPPSAGGIALLTMLNILAQYHLDTLPKVQWVHHLIEVMRLAYWQRDQFLADPDFVSIPTETLLSNENAKQLSKLIPKNKAINSQILKGTTQQPNHNNTTHFSIIDQEGNRVAATLTLNYIFGSSFVAEGTGILLNDEMDDFSIASSIPNVFGLVGNKRNAIAPGKRPLSSMTPTFLELPQRIAIVGTPGGSRIPTMMLLATLAFHEGYGAISMVSTMRFHHQYLPDLVQFEPDTFSPSLQQALAVMGYKLMPLKQYYGNMQAITWDRNNNLITASADPRNSGLASVISAATSGYGVRY